MSASLANSRKNFDAIVIGGGIAGASVGAFLAEDGLNIALLEKEDSLAYHTTGRSAALLTPYYGPESMRAFGTIGRPFLESPAFDSDLQVLSHRLTLLWSKNRMRYESNDRRKASGWTSRIVWSKCLS